MARSSRVRMCVVLTLGLLLAAALAGRSLEAQEAKKKPKSYRLPSTSLKAAVLWGSTAESPEGLALSFGGEDQKADDGQSHTRIKKDGEWVSLAKDLERLNPLAEPAQIARQCRAEIAQHAARVRRAWFEGIPFEVEKNAIGPVGTILSRLVPLKADLAARAEKLEGAGQRHLQSVVKQYLEPTLAELGELREAMAKSPRVEPAWLETLAKAERRVEHAAEALSAEPPPRALSPLVYEPQSKRFVVFAGDHCDYLTNDLWVFDPATEGWQQRRQDRAPPPRANHILKATGDGKITLTGGYTYTSSTDYVGGQYRDLDDGEWTYDVAANRWSREEEGVPGDSRTYRTGPFHPSYYYTGEGPDRAAVAKRLAELPANTWVKMNPPQLPRLNRDWGTAVLDPDHDLILRFSGGHSAHGGTDVLHYHMATNRWELCFPVEFPLGQLYTNTEYPEGFNFNLRPWVTGHTYQNYAYDPTARRMMFTGETSYTYYYDPVLGDWGPSAFGEKPRRVAKPAGMNYNSCFYDLTLCTTPLGAVAWTKDGRVFRHESQDNAWRELKLAGGEVKLPGSVVDNSTVVYDSKRDRLVFARKMYGDKQAYDGRLYTLDLKTLAVAVLEPEGGALGAAVPYLCQIRYDAESDLFLAGCTLPPADADGKEPRKTPAYDPAANRWLALAIGGDDPSGPKGRNVSLGMQYDAGRKLFWAVDTNSQVFVLRLKRE